MMLRRASASHFYCDVFVIVIFCSACKKHLLNAWEPNAQCRFLHGFAPHEALLCHVQGGTPRQKWEVVVDAWTAAKS